MSVVPWERWNFSDSTALLDMIVVLVCPLPYQYVLLQTGETDHSKGFLLLGRVSTRHARNAFGILVQWVRHVLQA